ncbi:MAG TPA: Maf-like protein [bacterium]|nr:Maf-like protein [bacterium]
MAVALDLFLASKSPRRAALLSAAGLRFEVCTPGEEYPGGGSEHRAEVGEPTALARERARRKALGASVPDPGVPVLAVDTVVDLDGVELGKAADERDARAILRRLGGREHRVHTAHCLGLGGAICEELATSVVACEEPCDAALEAYLDSGQWRGKAGCYGIQDSAQSFLRLVDGAFDTVVGLHIAAVRRLLQRVREAE